ncbi:hypothetical protein HPB48_007055 [Haemaphysalis longicornis]|uniref:Tick transposon n=1 Tax=Haemaphysalis longicornis TaxID=44386 RepID=A0A9J6GQ22_HAELO|nr:hypothetical protein HPB48_007055 [Haemaphysalis longicornis]
MRQLSVSLSGIETVNHTIYADNITIWCTGGSEGEVESSPQEAVDRTETFLEGTGLRCSTKKSELLFYRPVRKGPRPKGWKPFDEVNIKLHTKSGANIPRVHTLRILGMFI